MKVPSPAPYAMPYPHRNQMIVANEISSKFFNKMLDAFLDLTVPISSIANPACMNMTKKVETMIQTVSVSPSSLVNLSVRAAIANSSAEL
jgi:hypothetical protein